MADLTFSQFLDLVWHHVLSQSSVMANPHEYREVMKAVFHYSERTPEEVIAEHKAKQDAETKARPGRGGKGAQSAPLHAENVNPREVAKWQAMMSRNGSKILPADVPKE